MQTAFNFFGVEMVISWICSRDLFETSWEGLHEVLPIVIAEDDERQRFPYVCLRHDTDRLSVLIDDFRASSPAL